MAQRTAQMQAQGLANGPPQQRIGTPGGNPNLTSQMANAAQQSSGSATTNAVMAARAQQSQLMQSNFPNTSMNGSMTAGSPAIPQAQMQANMPNAQRMAPPDQARMASMQRSQLPNANQQHQFQLQQQQMNMANSMAQNMGMNNMPNANMMASMTGQNMNGNMTPMNGMSSNAGSPRNNQATPAMQTPARPLSSGHMPQLLQIQNNLKVQHPEWSQEQVQKMASDHLARFLTKQRAQAMNAAGGSPSMAHSAQISNNMYLQNGNMGAASPSPNAVQAYQQQLVRQQQMMSQQQQRAQAGSPGINARPSSRSATPQNPQQLQQQSPNLQ